jgi:predicted nucleic acid-binding protein
MAVVYFDSSALVKLMMLEVGSELVSEVWDGCDAAVSSRLAVPEVCAALAAAERNKLITRREYMDAELVWGMYWGAVRPIELSAEIADGAGTLARALSLRGSDAVHLASALALGLDDLVIAVWDRQLHAASILAGMRVVPASMNARGE